MAATSRAPDPADYHLTSRRQRFEALFTTHSSTVLAYALRRLDPADRELIELTSWEGLTPTEAAAVLMVLPSTLRSRLQRARHRLRTELEALGWTGPGTDDDQEES